MTKTHPDISLGELLVLLTVREINDRNILASDATILSIMDITPVVTGIDFGCPEILTLDAIESACRRLETLGYMTDKDTSRVRQDDAPPPHSLSAEEFETFGQATRFSADVSANLSREQYEAVFTVGLSRSELYRKMQEGRSRGPSRLASAPYGGGRARWRVGSKNDREPICSGRRAKKRNRPCEFDRRTGPGPQPARKLMRYE